MSQHMQEANFEPNATIERWADDEGNVTSFGRVEIPHTMEFNRADNQSGMRRALAFLSSETGLPLPADERSIAEPVIIVASPGKAEFYDTRKGNMRWHGLRQDGPHEYQVVQSERIGKDMAVGFGQGDVVYFGVVEGKAAAIPVPGHPGRELYGDVLAATAERRNRRLARMVPWVK